MRAILVCFLLCTAFTSGECFAEPSAEIIARGKALTDAGDCASCHTADPAKPFAGGKRIDTPFGGIYSPNLTPDRDTGIGAWSDEEFYRALRFGVGRDGSRYYPAFPYPNFTKLVRDDILAIRAYLATQIPIRNTLKPAELRWPLNYRVVMRVWNALFFKPGILSPTRRRARRGIADATSSRAPAIAAPAIRRKTCSAPTSAASNMPAGRSAACSRRGSTAPSAAG